MTEKVAQHSHCQICGKAIPLSETLCSEECKQRFTQMLRRRKIIMYFMFASIFAIIALIFLSSATI